MQLDITGRHVEIDVQLREFVQDKLAKLARLLDGPIEVHVVLGSEKHRHTAEIQVKSRTALFSGTHETSDLRASIAEVADKLERQALRHKEKVTTHKQRRGPRSLEAAAEIEARLSPEEPVQARGTDGPPRVVRRNRYRLKPLTLEDAVCALEETAEDVLVYRDAETDRVAVVYRQRDGSLAVVQPEF
jgi:putative sigma-54 modulation protein